MLDKKGRLPLRDLERNSFELKAGLDKGLSTASEAEYSFEPWLEDLLMAAAPPEEISGLSPKEWASGCELKADIRVEKIQTEYLLSAEVAAHVPAPCSRCAEPFTVLRELSWKSVYRSPQQPPKRARAAGVDLEDDADPDYAILKNEYLDLVALLSEQLVLAEGPAEAPPRLDDGTCTLCHKNPPLETAVGSQSLEAPQKEGASPFSALAGLKDKLDH